MIVKMMIVFLFVFVSSGFTQVTQEDFSSNSDEYKLLSDELSSQEKATAGIIEKKQSKPEINYVKAKPPTRKVKPDAAFQKAVARQLEMDKLDIEIEAAKKKMADEASKKIESPSSPAMVMVPQVVTAKEERRFLKIRKGYKNFINSLSPLELGVGLRLSTHRNEDAVNPERGFGMASSNQTGMRLGLSVQAKYKMAGLEAILIKSSDKLDLDYYGSSLGSLEIVTGPALIAKLFVVDDAKYSLSIGLGIESVKVNGAFSIGGLKAATKYNKTPTIVQISGQYKLNPDIAIGINYEISNLRISSEFPGVPAQVFNRGGCLVFTGNYRFLKP